MEEGGPHMKPGEWRWGVSGPNVDEDIGGRGTKDFLMIEGNTHSYGKFGINFDTTGKAKPIGQGIKGRAFFIPRIFPLKLDFSKVIIGERESIGFPLSSEERGPTIEKPEVFI